jgi:hypothetical protein
MPTFQTASNKQIAIKRQSGLGVPASGAGAAGYNVLPSSSLKLTIAQIVNNVIRRDGQSARNRHGSRSAMAAYKLPLSQGTLDPILEAALRGTFLAPIVITQATVLNGSVAAGNMTTTATTIVATTGSFLTQGVTRGQKIKLTGAHAAANNGPWFRVVSVTALVITVAGTAPLVLDAVASVAWTLTIAKQLLNPQTLIERYHTVEDYGQDNDLSILGTDMKVSKITFNAQPDALIEMEVTLMGLDAVGQTTGTSPVLTTPTYATTLPLVMSDGTIRVGGVDYPVMTGLQWTWDMGGDVPKVIGSPTGPDVFLGPGVLSGSFSAIRSDLTFFNAFRAETPVDFFIDCMEPDVADPKDFTSFYFGNITLSDNSTSIAKSGPDVEQVPWNAGIDDGGGDRALATMVVSSSAP